MTDLLLRASSLATASLGLFQLGLKLASTPTFPWPAGQTGTGNYPYIQGTTAGGIAWFVVICGGGTGQLLNAGVAYDTGFWMSMRWNGLFTAKSLPVSLVAYVVDGVAVTSATDTVNASAQTPVQPGKAILETMTVIA